MSAFSIDGIDVVTGISDVQLFRDGELIHTEDFGRQLRAIPAERHRKYLIDQSAILVNQFLSGELDMMRGLHPRR